MTGNDFAKVRDRIANAREALRPAKQKNHKLRRLVAGDLSVLDDGLGASAENMPLGLDEFYTVLVTDIEEGRSNNLFQAIRTLLFQTMHVFPDVEFQNMDPEQSLVMGAWVKSRLGPRPMGCDARHQMRLSLLDYMMGGIGWSMTCLQDDYPVILAVDSMDMAWDRSVLVPHDAEWAACRRRKPLQYWLDFFKSTKGFSDLLGDERNPDTPVAVWLYYTTDNQYVAFRDGEADEPITAEDNPYWMMTPRGSAPMIPFEPCYHMLLPGTTLPTSVAEAMLPAQIAIWEGKRRARDEIKMGTPGYDMEQGSYEEESLADFESGEMGTILKRITGKPPMSQRTGFPVDQGNLLYIQKNEQDLVAQSGVNPYTSGVTVDNLKFAAETKAIESNAGLMAGIIGKDNAAFWERTVRKVVAIGNQYDDQPFRAVVDEAVLEFDETDPIKDYLDPSADLVIQEDTMSFRPREQRIAEAMQFFQIATAVPEYPKFKAKAVEELLRAKGVKNVKEWMEQAAQGPTDAAMGAVSAPV